MFKPSVSQHTTLESSQLLRRSTSLALWFLAVLWLTATTAFGQNIKYTKGNTDAALRSNLEVDPSTLGMSIQIPINEYPGRGGNLPVALRYSSKVWRVRFMDTFKTGVNPVKTRTEGKWAEGTIAGWTTSLDLPKIDTIADNYRGPYDSSSGSYGQPYCISAGCYQTLPPPAVRTVRHTNYARMTSSLPTAVPTRGLTTRWTARMCATTRRTQRFTCRTARVTCSASAAARRHSTLTATAIR